ncbi:subunit of the Arp2/3 complex [Quaeritorhiza haematococci]|nr:subunit of the Arp2/3 complex [Quaeritorhiza haematococci]
MPAYHSTFNEGDYRLVGNLSLLPLKTKIRGPAPPQMDPSADDIVDEAIALFRANCFFRNFEIKGPADRVLIYLILFISECLLKLSQKTGPSGGISLVEAGKLLNTHALQNFAVPGDANFPLNAVYERPASRADADLMRQYISQLRQELATRLPERIWDSVEGKPSKWWMCFAKRKFMGIQNVTGSSI